MIICSTRTAICLRVFQHIPSKSSICKRGFANFKDEFLDKLGLDRMISFFNLNLCYNQTNNLKRKL